MGILHGGISVLLAETLGSCGAAFASPPPHHSLGLDINANHIRSVTEGWVTGTARPVHIGRTTHVWQIELVDDAGQLTCVCRITMLIPGSSKSARSRPPSVALLAVWRLITIRSSTWSYIKLQ